ncbi:unnamed protein product [Rotaria magnacalcarata]|uniref:PNPLA domain-containing protein n=1 Tax=Rotaria magnacalcarata TaxID=392030 RepID=A0A8S2LSC5_9BILA|nr:unnamed protein product [Rotaria magnacalcarata]
MNGNDLDQRFKELDTAIAKQQGNVLHLFQQLKSSIDDLEYENEEKYNGYRFQYHSRNASYLKALGKLDECRKEENLMRKYSEKCHTQEHQPIHNRENQYMEEIIGTAIQCEIQADGLIESAILKCLDDLQRFFEKEDKYINGLQSTIKDFTKESVNTLDDLFKLCSIHTKITTALNTLASQGAISSREDTDQDGCLLLEHLRTLSDDLEDLQYQRRVSFSFFVLSQRFRLRSILFANIPLTEERIQSHTKKLCILFHPDKCGPEEKPIFTEIFQLITEDVRKQLMDHEKRTSLVKYYERQGKEYWDIAVEYKNSRQQKWDKVKRLQKGELKNLSDKELEYCQNRYAIHAYEQYRAAARALERIESNDLQISQKVELKKYMALALYLAGNNTMLEAQIYVIAGIYLIVRSGNAALHKNELEDLKKLLEKIKGIKEPTTVVSDDTVETKTEPELIGALVEYNCGASSLSRFEGALSSEMRTAILQKCSLRTEQRSVAIPQESILEVRKKGAMFFTKGAACVGTGGGVALYIAGNAAYNIYAGATIGTVFGGPIGTIVGIGFGVLSIAAGGLLGYIFFKQGNRYLKEPKVREALNKIMENALQHYQKEEYSAFLRSLSIPYNDKEVLIKIQDVTIGDIYKISLEILPEKIVKELLYHDFSPEGIAYLLVLLGEVLLSAPKLEPKEKEKVLASMHVDLPTFSDFNYNATKVFEEVWINQDLLEQAQHIDKRIKSMISLAQHKYMKKVMAATLAYTYSVSRNYIKERLKISATDCLQELKNVAQINFAITQIVIGGTDNLNKSINIIKEIKKNLTNENSEPRMFQLADFRLQALSDLLIAFGYSDELSTERCAVSIKDIDLVLTDNQTFAHCQQIIPFDDDEADEFALLDRVLYGILKLDNNRFAEDMSKAYDKNLGIVKSHATEIIRTEHFSSFIEWKNSLLTRKHSLTLQMLPILSSIYNLIFKLCIVEQHCDHNHIFFPTREIFDYSTNSNAAIIYAIIDEDKNAKGDNLIKGVFVTCDVPLNYVYNQLDHVSDPKTRANLFNQIAIYYRQEAEETDKVHHLSALPKWDHILKFYNESLMCDKNNLVAMLGYTRCLLKLHKYKQAECILIEKQNEDNSEFFKSPERWFLLGLLNRKLHKYNEAMYAVREAVGRGYNSTEVENELNLIKRLTEESTAERIKLYKRMNIRHAEPKFEQYNILSIDGGGIRGLVSAIWVCELERVTGLNSSSMFHMMSGTSVGAILTAGLSLPDKHHANMPRYSAKDIVQLYIANFDRVFSRKSFLKNALFSSYTYSDEGRKKLFDQYFEDTRLSQTLTDLIIPAVHSGSNTTVLFRRSESLIDSRRNNRLADILMCTTAAPTYFAPYVLQGKAYADGGVQANNPASIAYSEACRSGINRDNILVLSLGTGDYVPDPLHPNANRNLLFWLTNKDSILKVVFDGPQNNIDCQLNNILGTEKYHRWQVWLEKPIKLDDTRENTINYLTELARAQFEEMDAYDNDKRLGKLIERLRDQTN